MDPNTITLDYPIDFEGSKLSEITLRRPKVGDISRASSKAKGEIPTAIELTAILSGLPPAAIEDLDAADFAKLQETVAGFLG